MLRGGVLPHKLSEQITYYKNWHRLINFKNPKYFDEKLMVLKATKYSNNNLIKKCIDKYEVRKYVESKGLKEILNQLYFVCDRVEDIDISFLPEKFVLKANHGCGYNIIVQDKSKFDLKKAKDKLKYWLEEDYGVISGEYTYKNIPRKIICENYIGTDDGILPIDYKFFCSRGKVICALLIIGRYNDEKWLFVDKEYKDLKFVDFADKNISKYKPKCFDDMVSIAGKLSEDFDFVRVDLYQYKDKVIFGELTFTPHGCIHKYLSNEAQLWIGEKIEIDNRSK